MNRPAQRLLPAISSLLIILCAGTVPSPAGAQPSSPTCVPTDDSEGAPRRRRRPGAEQCPPSQSVPATTEAPVRRRRPGGEGRELPAAEAYARERDILPLQRSDIPRPALADYSTVIPVPDRWRIVEALYDSHWWDPYNRNVLKGDRPIRGEDWFFVLTAVSDTVADFRNVATPVGVQSSDEAGSYNTFGGQDQFQFVETIAIELSYIKGDTVFRPPDWEFRLTPVFQYNYTQAEEVLLLNVDPREGTARTDYHAGLQAAFVDYHIRNVSPHYDFDSLRIGIQPINADFRGFLFLDEPFGVRLFGTRKNNIFQYNLAWFRRLEKDVNSGLNDLSESPREDDVFLANLYWQDMPVLGYTSQFTAVYNRNREDEEIVFDTNGFIARPASIGAERLKSYDVVYLGYNGDGHFGRFNITDSFYYATGEVENAIFSGKKSDINAYFAAVEASVDFDWQRYRLSFLYGSGDDDPFDDEAEAFDAIFENPLFAGADTSYWIRQSVPLIGGGRVALSARNGILNSLRSSKEMGQSNFTNPGIMLFGVGADYDLTPELRLSFNANQLWFDTTETLEVARNQANIDEEIGLDLSVSVTWRPLMTQNIIFRASYAALIPGDGYEDLFPDDDLPFSLLFNVILTY